MLNVAYVQCIYRPLFVGLRRLTLRNITRKRYARIIIVYNCLRRIARVHRANIAHYNILVQRDEQCALTFYLSGLTHVLTAYYLFRPSVLLSFLQYINCIVGTLRIFTFAHYSRGIRADGTSASMCSRDNTLLQETPVERRLFIIQQ